MAKLIITEGGRDKVFEIVDDEFTIGSGPEADLQLRSEGVSSLHVTVQKTKAGFRLIDMETKDGTVVNGKNVNEHILANGDTISLADVRITYMGKGPARAAGGAARKKGPKLESSKYYRHDAPKKTSQGALLTMVFGVIGVAALFIFLMFSSEDPAAQDMPFAELSNALRQVKKLGFAERGKAEEMLKKYKNQSQLDERTRKVYKELKREYAKTEKAAEQSAAYDQARDDYRNIKKVYLHEPENNGKLKQLLMDYQEKYAEIQTQDQNDVADMLDKILTIEQMSPEQKEVERVRKLVQSAIARKELHDGQRAVNEMDPAAKSAYPEEVEGIQRHLRMKSRQWLGVRKNEVRFHLREDHYDPAAARKYAIDMIFTKLVHSTIEDYLASPDKYSIPKNQAAEVKTQALLRQLLTEIKPNY